MNLGFLDLGKKKAMGKRNRASGRLRYPEWPRCPGECGPQISWNDGGRAADLTDWWLVPEKDECCRRGSVPQVPHGSLELSGLKDLKTKAWHTHLGCALASPGGGSLPAPRALGWEHRGSRGGFSGSSLRSSHPSEFSKAKARVEPPMSWEVVLFFPVLWISVQSMKCYLKIRSDYFLTKSVIPVALKVAVQLVLSYVVEGMDVFRREFCRIFCHPK